MNSLEEDAWFLASRGGNFGTCIIATALINCCFCIAYKINDVDAYIHLLKNWPCVT